MLRYEHLPSDFHPKFLILGEREDFAALARLLRRFASDGQALDVGASVQPRPKGPSLRIEAATDLFGLRQQGVCYLWYMNAYQAEAIAARIDVLADEETVNGSDQLEFGVQHEIPVAVSLGEFPDEYLDTRGP